MRAILEHLTADDEVGLVRFGQSNSRAWGHRDREGFVAAPHLKLRAPGLDLTIQAIASATGGAHGGIGTQSFVTVAEALTAQEWVLGELRLVQFEFGDSVPTSLRRGHAKVLANLATVTNTTAPIFGSLAFDTTAETVYWPNHGRRNGSQVVFDTTGALPGLTAGVPYWVRDAAAHTFKVSADPYGAAVNLAGGSGIHSCTALPGFLVEWQSECMAPATVTFLDASGFLWVNSPAHGLTAGSAVSFSGGTVPTGVTPGATYYVVLLLPPLADGYMIAATYGGSPLPFVNTGSGTITATPLLLSFVAGYVHLHDKWTSYDNVQVVTPYQPIEPGPYPAGVPVVPGFTLQSDVQSYADAAVVLPFTFNEGVDGYGLAGECTVTGNVATITSGGPLPDKLFADGFLRVGGAKGKVASNGTGTVTVHSWTPSGGPGAGTLPFVVHLPHWRNNPHHFTAGEGFLYPSHDMQPGGTSVLSSGYTYSRPRARLTGSYVGKALAYGTVSSAINATAGTPARLSTTGLNDLVCSIAGGKLRIMRATPSSSPATGLIQFEAFLRAGMIVQLGGMGQAPSINGNWRVSAMGHTYGAAGSYVDLEQLDATTPAVPASVSGDVPAGASVSRLWYEPQHRFGSLLELSWRLAVSVGRRLIVAHLGVNSSGQVLRNTNNQFGFQGQIGWRTDDESLDWTPSNEDGNAARLQRVVEFIAPRAVQATFGTARKWKVLAIDGWQAEADALSEAGRQLAARSIPTFANWLRRIVDAAGLSPYRNGARVPFHWAQVSHVPYELSGSVTEYPGFVFSGDADGIVNKAISRFAALAGFAATIDTDAAPKLDGTTFFGIDPLHFNGFGEAKNGKEAAAAILPQIDLAFSFSLGTAAVELANQALSIIGEAPNVVSLEPPNNTQQAKLCAQFMAEARNAVLQAHPWTFATRRVQPVAVDNTVSTYAYAYAVPVDLLCPTHVLDPEATDDAQLKPVSAPTTAVAARVGETQLASQPFRLETEDGFRILRTNQPNAVLVYTARNVDFELWDPLVRQACAFHLAHLLVGSIVKGKTGAAVSLQYLEQSRVLLQQAAANNAEYQTDVRTEARAPWLP